MLWGTQIRKTSRSLTRKPGYRSRSGKNTMETNSPSRCQRSGKISAPDIPTGPQHWSLPRRTGWFKLQALVYDILPSTAAVFSYAIGSRKLSANEQFFVGAQTVVSLLQTTQNKTCHLGCFYRHISTRNFRRALTASVDSCAEIKSAPSVT